MLTSEKAGSIKRQLRRGVPEGEIKEQLKREGYSEMEIAVLFKPHHYDMRSWYLFWGIALCLLGLYGLIVNGNPLGLLFGYLLFISYKDEIKRLKSLEKFREAY